MKKKNVKENNRFFSPISPAVWPAIGDIYSNVLFYYTDNVDFLTRFFFISVNISIPQIKIKSLKKQSFKSDIAIFAHGGSLEITLTVPLT